MRTEKEIKDDLNWISHKIQQKRKEIKAIERELKFHRNGLVMMENLKLACKNELEQVTVEDTLDS